MGLGHEPLPSKSELRWRRFRRKLDDIGSALAWAYIIACVLGLWLLLCYSLLLCLAVLFGGHP